MWQVLGFGNRSTGRGTLGRIWTAPLLPMGTLGRACETVPQPSELRFGVVCAVGQGIAILHGVHVVQREGEVLGGCSPFSQWEMPLGRRRRIFKVQTSIYWANANDLVYKLAEVAEIGSRWLRVHVCGFRRISTSGLDENGCRTSVFGENVLSGGR